MANWKPFVYAILTLSSGGLIQGAAADPAPVVEAGAEVEALPNENTPSTVVVYPQNERGDVQVSGLRPSASASTEERLSVLSKQVNNIVSMNFVQQIAELQQQIAELRGQLAVQTRELQLLKSKTTAMLTTPVPNSSPNTDPKNAELKTPVPSSNNASAALDTVQYQEAFDLMSTRKYQKAQQAFLSYIASYPQGKYIADAHYWLGEIYNIDKNYRNAESEFQRVLTKYPKSAKVTDAKLKVAMIHANTDQIDKAKIELRDITKNYPDSAVAQLANIRLQQLEQSDSLDN